MATVQALLGSDFPNAAAEEEERGIINGQSSDAGRSWVRGKEIFIFFPSRFPFLRDESDEVRGICGDHRLNGWAKLWATCWKWWIRRLDRAWKSWGGRFTKVESYGLHLYELQMRTGECTRDLCKFCFSNTYLSELWISIQSFCTLANWSFCSLKRTHIQDNIYFWCPFIFLQSWLWSSSFHILSSSHTRHHGTWFSCGMEMAFFIIPKRRIFFVVHVVPQKPMRKGTRCVELL